MIHVFIVNPRVCERDYAQNLRQKLSRIPRLNYYVLTSSCPGNETELVALLCHFFDNEVIRFYCCGGDGTFKKMLDGIPDISRVEMAFLPYGKTDFIKNFKGDLKACKNVDAMIKGRVVYIDYIETNLGRALNSVSVGVDAKKKNVKERVSGLKVLGKAIHSATVSLYATFVSTDDYYDVSIDEYPSLHIKYGELFFGNGAFLDQKLRLGIDNIINDGLANLSVFAPDNYWGRIYAVGKASKSNPQFYELPDKISHASKISLRRDNGSAFYVSLDGEVVMTHELRAGIVKQGLAIVLPAGVEFDE